MARDKDVTTALLEFYGYKYDTLSVTRSRGASVSAAKELALRSLELRTRIKDWGARVVLTRNPTGVLASIGTGARSVFDTDDGRNAGLHYWLARPFADVITSSTFDPEDHGDRLRRYRAIKAQMFLHPRNFQPDASVLQKYNLVGSRVFVARFSAYSAAHDSGATGLSLKMRREIIERLSSLGILILSIEGEGLRVLRHGSLKVEETASPEDFHHLLAVSELYVGDSQSVAGEASVLGTPTLHFSSFARKLFYLNVLEQIGLLQCFSPGQEPEFARAFLRAVESGTDAQPCAKRAAAAFNDSTEDLPRWYRRLVWETLRQ